MFVLCMDGWMGGSVDVVCVHRGILSSLKPRKESLSESMDKPGGHVSEISQEQKQRSQL